MFVYAFKSREHPWKKPICLKFARHVATYEYIIDRRVSMYTVGIQIKIVLIVDRRTLGDPEKKVPRLLWKKTAPSSLFEQRPLFELKFFNDLLFFYVRPFLDIIYYTFIICLFYIFLLLSLAFFNRQNLCVCIIT